MRRQNRNNREKINSDVVTVCRQKGKIICCYAATREGGGCFLSPFCAPTYDTIADGAQNDDSATGFPGNPNGFLGVRDLALRFYIRRAKAFD